LPNATVDQSYHYDFYAVGGTSPFVWAVTGGSLPPGLEFADNGHLTGIPTLGGDFALTVMVTDSCGATAAGGFALRVLAPLAITAETLAGVLVGRSYEHPFIATGGEAPYAWTIDGGYVPLDLHLDADGRLSGLPKVAGNFTFRLRATDSALASVTQVFTLVVTDSDSDGDGVSDEWEFANGMTVGTSDGDLDSDGDGHNNRAEYIAGTNPQASSSAFGVQSMVASAQDEMTLTWPGVGGRSYQVLSSPDMKTWTPGSAVIDCANSGPLTATVPTAGADNLFFKLSVEIRN
jgi:hypothetical protein